MLLTQPGLMVPLLRLSIKWDQILDASLQVPETILATIEAFADRLARDRSIATYASFIPRTVVDGPFTLYMTSPISLETMFADSVNPTEADLPGLLVLAPKLVTSRAVTYKKLKGTFVETIGHKAVAARVGQVVCEALALGPNRAIYAARRDRLAAEYAKLRLQFASFHLPSKVYQADDTDVVISLPGVAWPDDSSYRQMDHAAALSVSASAFGALSTNPTLRATLSDVLAGQTHGVSLNAVTSRNLSESERATLVSYAGSLALIPAFVLDALGTTSRVLDGSALVSAQVSVMNEIVKQIGYEPIVDLDVSPRSVEELFALVAPGATQAFVRSIDAFYRRKLLPTLAGDMPANVRQQVHSIHPLLLDGFTPTGPRSGQLVRTVSGTARSWELVYPTDAIAQDYVITPSASIDAARLELQRFNAFITACFVIAGGTGVSPAVLRNLGLSSVRRGYAFALPA